MDSCKKIVYVCRPMTIFSDMTTLDIVYVVFADAKNWLKDEHFLENVI